MMKTAVRMPKIPENMKAIAVLKNMAGNMVGLKNPDQKLPSSSQLPGVSMKSMIPLIRKRDSQANMKYSHPIFRCCRGRILPKV